MSDVRMIFLQVLLAYASYNPKYNLGVTAFKVYFWRVLRCDMISSKILIYKFAFTKSMSVSKTHEIKKKSDLVNFTKC